MKPGGVILATVGGISDISQWDMERWGALLELDHARRLFEEAVPSTGVHVDADGNVLAATACLQGLAAKELRPEELDHRDPDYEVLITVRAQKSPERHDGATS